MGVTMRWTTILLAAALITGMTVVQAQEQPDEPETVDSVLLAAQEADILVASSVAESFDTPLLMTDAEQLSNETITQMEQLQPSEVNIIGGPAALSDEVVDTVEEFESVEQTDRIYSDTASDTSVEVSQMFWEEAEEALVIHGEVDQNVFNQVFETQVDGPVLLSMEEHETEMPEENETEENETVNEDNETPVEENETVEQNQTIEQQVTDELERLDVQNVVLYAEDEDIVEQLEELDIQVQFEQIETEEEPLEENEDNGFTEDLQERLEDLLNNETDE